MTGKRVTRILCAGGPRGSDEAIAGLRVAADGYEVDAVALVGDLSDGSGGRGAYRRVFDGLGRSGRPTYWVPGPADAPIDGYLREVHAMEIVHPSLHGVHGTAAFAPDEHVVFAGFGGEVSDEPDSSRDEFDRLRYPHWEPDYRLKILAELGEHQSVFLFHTPPAHKGLNRPGSDALAELIGTYRPRLVVCGGEAGSEMLGSSLVVSPGSLADGEYALADLQSQEVELERLAVAG
jgi:hypothetical protein